jgi:hypothetical protein
MAEKNEPLWRDIDGQNHLINDLQRIELNGTPVTGVFVQILTSGTFSIFAGDGTTSPAGVLDGENGDLCILGDGGVIYQNISSPSPGNTWTPLVSLAPSGLEKKTTVTVDQNMAVDFTIDLSNLAAPEYTVSGDTAYLGANATEFNDSNPIRILSGGRTWWNGDDVVWVDSTSFQIKHPLQVGQSLIVFS